MSLKEMPAEQIIENASKRLKAMPEFKPPEWSVYVKTGSHKERVPQDEDWWWIRSASILRKVGLSGKIGVSALRKEYGGRKNKGHKPERKYKAGGSIIRKILQQHEAAGFMMKVEKQGRKITPKGLSFLLDTGKGKKAK
jgi:small subunit ribosomal protein S19e